MDPHKDKAHHDPNKTKEKGFAFDKGKRNLKCKYCHAVYIEKHWEKFDDLDPKYIDELHESVCPACHEKHNHISDGVLHLSGSFLPKHKDEIKRTILNIGEHEEQRDVLNRIERIEESGPEKITVYTTKNQLAVEIGKKISDAFKGGEFEIHWSKGDKAVEVFWNRN